jgi:hypothetical protein
MLILAAQAERDWRSANTTACRGPQHLLNMPIVVDIMLRFLDQPGEEHHEIAQRHSMLIKRRRAFAQRFRWQERRRNDQCGHSEITSRIL